MIGESKMIKLADKKRVKVHESPLEISTQQLQFVILNCILKYLDASPPEAGFVCRRSELLKLLSLAQKVRCSPKKGHIVHIHGQPGTGKTHTVNHFLNIVYEEKILFKGSLPSDWVPADCIINGAMIHGPLELFRKFMCCVVKDEEYRKHILKVCKSAGIIEGITELKKHKLTVDKTTQIIVIDEEDQLTNPSRKKSPRHYRMTLNELVSHFRQFAIDCGIVLILISNVLRFDDLKEGQANSTRIVFDPYTEEEFREILDQRIQSAKNCLISCELSNYSDSVLSYNPFESSAKTFALKHIASHRGDCRELLHTCRELIRQQLASLTSLKRRRRYQYPSLLRSHYTYLEDDVSSDASSPVKQASPDDSPIQLHSAVQTIKSKLRTSQDRCLQLLNKLPLHHQILLCSTCVALQNDPDTLSVYSVFTHYKELCQEYTIPIEYKSHMRILEALQSLEAMGILRVMIIGSPYKKRNEDSLRCDAMIEICFGFDSICEILKECKQIFKIWLNK